MYRFRVIHLDRCHQERLDHPRHNNLAAECQITSHLNPDLLPDQQSQPNQVHMVIVGPLLKGEACNGYITWYTFVWYTMYLRTPAGRELDFGHISATSGDIFIKFCVQVTCP